MEQAKRKSNSNLTYQNGLILINFIDFNFKVVFPFLGRKKEKLNVLLFITGKLHRPKHPTDVCLIC